MKIPPRKKDPGATHESPVKTTQNESPAVTLADESPEARSERRIAELAEKARLLALNLNCFKVHPIYFQVPDSDEEVIGFLKEPPLQAKLAVMDMALRNPFSAATDILDHYIIKEESDPRLYDKRPENDAFYIGATSIANELIEMYRNQFKKK